MKHLIKKFALETKKQFEMVDVTGMVAAAVAESGIQNGLCTVFCPHTTAGVRINHNEPLLVQDIMKALYHLVPIDVGYSHDLFELRQNVTPTERSNGHAHLKSFLIGSSESIIVEKSKLILGTKQSIFFVEFDGGRARELIVQVLGE